MFVFFLPNAATLGTRQAKQNEDGQKLLTASCYIQLYDLDSTAVTSFNALKVDTFKTTEKHRADMHKHLVYGPAASVY